MSAKMLLAAIQTLELANMDNEALTNLDASLNLIVDHNTFDGLTQQEAFCKSVQIKELIAKREADTQAKCDALWQAEMKREAEKAAKKLKTVRKAKKQVEEVKDNENGNDELVRLMIRAEEDGTLSFEFRGIRWDFNHNLGAWDYSKPDSPKAP
jgi:hypothetical protein